jgi:hypothetical protein
LYDAVKLIFGDVALVLRLDKWSLRSSREVSSSNVPSETAEDEELSAEEESSWILVDQKDGLAADRGSASGSASAGLRRRAATLGSGESGRGQGTSLSVNRHSYGNDGDGFNSQDSTGVFLAAGVGGQSTPSNSASAELKSWSEGSGAAGAEEVAKCAACRKPFSVFRKEVCS